MSAWLVTDDHLSAMVQSVVVEGARIGTPLLVADRVWQEAKFQNLWALHCRYGDEMPVDRAEELEVNRKMVEAPLDPQIIVALIACWEYQCAEFDGYDQTIVSELFKSLTDWLCKSHDFAREDAVRRGPWGITDITEAIDRSATHQEATP